MQLRSDCLGHITIESWRIVFIGSFKILSCDEVLDTLLDERDLGFKTTRELCKDFAGELRMREFLSRPTRFGLVSKAVIFQASQYVLHNSNNCSVNNVSSCLVVLVLGTLSLRRVFDL